MGALRRADSEPYNFCGKYELVEAAPWRIESTDHMVEMYQAFTYGPYAYNYTYTLFLESDSTFSISHRLENCGELPIHQAYYSHNFFTLSDCGTGTGLELEFPFNPAFENSYDEVAEVSGKKLSFRKWPDDLGAAFSPLSGFGTEETDNGFTLRQRDADITVRVTANRPVLRYHLFATPRTICPEPFIDLRIPLGSAQATELPVSFHAVGRAPMVKVTSSRSSSMSRSSAYFFASIILREPFWNLHPRDKHLKISVMQLHEYAYK